MLEVERPDSRGANETKSKRRAEPAAGELEARRGARSSRAKSPRATAASSLCSSCLTVLTSSPTRQTCAPTLATLRLVLADPSRPHPLLTSPSPSIVDNVFPQPRLALAAPVRPPARPTGRRHALSADRAAKPPSLRPSDLPRPPRPPRPPLPPLPLLPPLQLSPLQSLIRHDSRKRVEFPVRLVFV